MVTQQTYLAKRKQLSLFTRVGGDEKGWWDGKCWKVIRINNQKQGREKAEFDHTAGTIRQSHTKDDLGQFIEPIKVAGLVM